MFYETNPLIKTCPSPRDNAYIRSLVETHEYVHARPLNTPELNQFRAHMAREARMWIVYTFDADDS